MNSMVDGRRPGSPPTREDILQAAITSFTEHGYGGTTIRAVARLAGVDPALVMHFFASKDGLFEAAIRAGMPAALLARSFEGEAEGLGERLATRYLELWDDPVHGRRLAAVLRAASASPAAAGLLERLMRESLLGPLTGHLEPAHAETRAVLAGSQLIGIAMFRYVLRIEPIASMPPERLVATITPALQRCLTGPLPLG